MVLVEVSITEDSAVATLLALDRNEFIFPHAPAVEGALCVRADLSHYAPIASRQHFLNGLASFLGLERSNITLGHGAEDLILRLLLLHRQERRSVVMPSFSWGEYSRMVGSLGLGTNWIPMVTSQSSAKGSKEWLEIDLGALAQILGTLSPTAARQTLVLLPTTNNPTGSRCDHEALISIVDANPSIVFLLDAVYEPLPSPLLPAVGMRPNVHIIGSMSKFFGLPGLRLGFCTGPVPEAFQMALGPGGWAFSVAEAALASWEYYRDVRLSMTQDAAQLASLPLRHLVVHGSAAPFVLVDGGILPSHERPNLQDAVAQSCEQISLVKPKCFVHEGKFWMRFGLGPTPVVAAVAEFLSQWDCQMDSLRPGLGDRAGARWQTTQQAAQESTPAPKQPQGPLEQNLA